MSSLSILTVALLWVAIQAAGRASRLLHQFLQSPCCEIHSEKGRGRAVSLAGHHRRVQHKRSCDEVETSPRVRGLNTSEDAKPSCNIVQKKRSQGSENPRPATEEEDDGPILNPNSTQLIFC